VLRDNWCFENPLFSYPQALQSGTKYTAAAKGKTAHIARDDLARAAAVLSSNKSGKHTYTLSGAKAYTTDEIATLISKATDKPINVVHGPVDGFVQGMIGAGVPEGTSADFKALTGVEPLGFGKFGATCVMAGSRP
jgi:NAD(P)H dehydrogenase (quinone)